MNPSVRRTGRTPLLALLLLAGLVAAGCGSVAKPQGWAGAVVNSDVVYASRGAGKLGAYRMDSTGRIWEFPGQGVKLKLLGIYGTPVLAGDTIYVSGYDGSVAALAATDGSERWQHNAGKRVVGGTLVTADTVYAGTDAGDLVALNRTDGTERWRGRAGNQVWSTPVTDGSLIVVAAMDGWVTAFRPDGSQAWHTRVAQGAIAGTPALKDGVLYLGSYDRRLYAVDAATGATRWHSDQAGNWFWTEPVIDGDTLVAGNLDGHVYALDIQDGRQRWQASLGAPVRARGAVVSGVFVVPAKNGRLWGLRLQDGGQAWEPSVVGGTLYADLTVAPSGLYLSSGSGGSGQKLYRIDAASGVVTEILLGG